MKNRFRLLALIFLLLTAAFAAADGEATWSAKLDRADVRAGEVARVVIEAKLKQGWHAYSIVPVQDGPFPTTIQPATGVGIEAVGKIEEQAPHVQLDQNFGKQVGTFEGSAEFYAPFKVKGAASGHQSVTVDLRYMVCNSQNCLPPKPVSLKVDFDVQPGPAREQYAKYVPISASSAVTPGSTESPGRTSSTDEVSASIQKAQSNGLFAFILLAFGAGLLSLLTPCVFPMIPITVSFFTKQKNEDGKVGLAGPVAYCLGIIVTFTGLGVLVSASGVRAIATNVWVNVFLAALFIVLAASLFGVFEIALPSWLVNSASRKSRSGGLVGPLLMGLTFTLTSFTCTVPFVGTLLATSTQGGLLYPIIGMLAFSTAFALPFFLLALFPTLLAKLPRSGAWLVTVKAFMGFLELMAALKFLSNVDLSLRLGWLTKPVFLAIWAGTAAIGALYLLGWLRLPHDGEVKVGWIRRVFGVATVALAVLCLSGIEGHRLGTIASFLPPDPYPGQADKGNSGLAWESTYDGALAKARAEGKNVFIDFTGIYCTNCRDIELNVFTQPQVKMELGKFVLARLFTDEGTPADDANHKLQLRLSGVDTLPLYAVVSPEGKVLKIHQQQPPIEDANQFLGAIRPFSQAVVAEK